MIKVNAELYQAAQAQLAAGFWCVDPERGLLTRDGVIAGSPNTSGYLRVRWTQNGARLSALAHRVVWEATRGQIPIGMYVNHRDGVKINNAVDNLELVTHAENMSHARSTGLLTPLRGSAAPAAKLSSIDVEAVRSRASHGESHRLIARDFGVARSTITRVVNARHYAA